MSFLSSNWKMWSSKFINCVRLYLHANRSLPPTLAEVHFCLCEPGPHAHMPTIVYFPLYTNQNTPRCGLCAVQEVGTEVSKSVLLCVSPLSLGLACCWSSFNWNACWVSQAASFDLCLTCFHEGNYFCLSKTKYLFNNHLFLIRLDIRLTCDKIWCTALMSSVQSDFPSGGWNHLFAVSWG